jgi:hypothetical protein
MSSWMILLRSILGTAIANSWSKCQPGLSLDNIVLFIQLTLPKKIR